MARAVSALFITTVFLVCAYLGIASRVAATAGGTETLRQDSPIEMSDESIATGRQVYGRFCRSYHGLSADGDGNRYPW